MPRSFLQLVYIHVLEFAREPGAIFWSFFFPVIMAWGLGIAFSSKMETKRNVALICNDTTFVHDLQGRQNTSRKDSVLTIVLGNSTSGITRYEVYITSRASANLMLKRGVVALIIENSDGRITYQFDARNNEGQLSYLQLEQWIKTGDDILKRGEISFISQKGIRYIDFLIPGMLAMNVMSSVLWGVSYTTIERRSKKLLRRMVATPMKKWEYMGAMFFTRYILCILEGLATFALARWYFDVSIEGSMFTVFMLFTAGFISFAGISVLVSSRTANTYVGNGLINAVVMPMMLLSGVFFSYHNYPDTMVAIIKLLPLTSFADAMRSVFIEGSCLYSTLPTILGLTASGLVFSFIGLKIFKWH